MSTNAAADRDAFHFYEPAHGHGLPHDPFKAIVAPRPIGWISTIDNAGNANLSPYSFFNGICTFPPMVMFASEGFKDSVRNAAETGEFVCNLATRALAERMNRSSAALPPGVSEFDFAGIERAACRLVKPPRVAEAPAALECRVVSVLRLTDVEGRQLNYWLTIGQVVGVHVARECLVDGIFDMTRAGTIARCGYVADYVEVQELFQLNRPR